MQLLEGNPVYGLGQIDHLGRQRTDVGQRQRERFLKAYGRLLRHGLFMPFPAPAGKMEFKSLGFKYPTYLDCLRGQCGLESGNGARMGDPKRKRGGCRSRPVG
jgi:hypothetical protein